MQSARRVGATKSLSFGEHAVRVDGIDEPLEEDRPGLGRVLASIALAR